MYEPQSTFWNIKGVEPARLVLALLITANKKIAKQNVSHAMWNIYMPRKYEVSRVEKKLRTIGYYVLVMKTLTR